MGPLFPSVTTLSSPPSGTSGFARELEPQSSELARVPAKIKNFIVVRPLILSFGLVDDGRYSESQHPCNAVVSPSLSGE